MEWQIPVGLELVAAGIMLFGCLTLPESTRWLLSKGRNDEAWKSLAWIRGSEGSATQDEFTETQLGLRAEEAAKESFRLKELLEPANRLRFFIGPVMFIFQNTTGSSALAVFAPQYFKLLVGSTGTRDLLLTGLFGAVKVIACTFFIWVLAERFGRRTLLTSGSALMAVCMLITALIVDEVPTESNSNVTSAGRATVAMIYLDIMVRHLTCKSTGSTGGGGEQELTFESTDLQLLLGSLTMGLRARDLPDPDPSHRACDDDAGPLGHLGVLLHCEPLHDRQCGREYLFDLHGI